MDNFGKIIIDLSLKQKTQDALPCDKPKPFRLVMIPIVNICQFCKNPEGGAYISYVNISEHNGFICCEKQECRLKMTERRKEFLEDIGFAKLINLSGKIKVKRSSGIIDDGWRVYENDSLFLFEDKYYAMVIKEICSSDIPICKYVKIEELLENNK